MNRSSTGGPPPTTLRRPHPAGGEGGGRCSEEAITERRSRGGPPRSVEGGTWGGSSRWRARSAVGGVESEVDGRQGGERGRGRWSGERGRWPAGWRSSLSKHQTPRTLSLLMQLPPPWSQTRRRGSTHQHHELRRPEEV
jgi:hypothetical protein